MKSFSIALLGFLLMLTYPHRADTAEEKALLVTKALAGQSVRYKSISNLVLESQGRKVNFEATEVEKATFTTVLPNGNVVSEHITESSDASINGNKLPEGNEPKSTTTITVRPDGSLLSYKTSGKEPGETKTQARLYAVGTSVFSDKPVGIGDKWTHQFKADSDIGIHEAKADFEVLGFEKMNGIETVKIKMEYAETDATPAIAAHSTIWVEKSSGDQMISETTAENVPFGGAMASGKIHQERLDGSPLGEAKPVDIKNTGKPADKKTEPKKEKMIDEVVKDYEKIPGLFTIYKKKENGRDTIYMEIKESLLDKLLMMEVTASTGNSSQIVAGDPINDLLFKFVKLGDDKVQIVVPNIHFRAEEKSPTERAVKRSFADGIIESFKIEGVQADRKSVLINVSDLFKGDIAEISSQLSGPFGGGYILDREKTYVDLIKSFPENLVVQTYYHFMKGGGGSSGIAALFGGGEDVSADHRSLPFKVIYTLFPLPDKGYRPRLADSRIGYFLTDYQDFNITDKSDIKVRYIYRWDLQKKDPKAALSEPKQPIVFWLDNAIPMDYRSAVSDGLLFWNKAFEKIGFKNAVVVKQMPDSADWDHADMRYNTIRWVASPSAAYAVALARHNPLTGQILNANITVDINYTRYMQVERARMVDPALAFAEPGSAAKLKSDPTRCEFGKGMMEQAYLGNMALSMLGGPGFKLDEKAYLQSFIRELVSHEMGHIMGLRHNFIASMYHSPAELTNGPLVRETGTASSVMDYTPFNIYAIKKKNVDYFMPTVGPYDIWAIQYGYTPIESKTSQGEKSKLNEIASRDNEPGHRYESDEIADQFDPEVTRYDLTSDPIAYFTKTSELSRYLLLNLDKRIPKFGDSYNDFTHDFFSLLSWYARSISFASRYIGGITVNRSHAGDPGEKPNLIPVSATDQKRALNLLNTYLFSENAFSLPKSYLGKLTQEPFDFAPANTFPMLDQFTNVQAGALRRIFSSAVLSRIQNNEYRMSNATLAFTLPYLYHSVGQNVWSELDIHKNISVLRRSLQRNHLQLLIDQFLGQASGTPEDARVLAWQQLRNLKESIASASRRGKYDEYTQLHLEDCSMRISRALDAKQTIGGANSGRTLTLRELLGGSEQQPAVTR